MAALDSVLRLSTLVAADMAQIRRGLGTDDAPASTCSGHWVSPGPPPQRSLATSLDVTPRNVTGLVDGLVASGHVTREPYPTDRRATLVTLTELGRRTVRDLRDSHEDLAGQLFGAVQSGRLASFVRTLDETIATFERLMEEAK